MTDCPCGSGSDLEQCCGPVIAGERDAATAEELMRSRYSAYVLGEIDWIVASHHSETSGDLDRDHIERWSRESEWLGLEISDTEDGGPDDSEGSVRFTARYRAAGVVTRHEERAWFSREDGQWKFHTVLSTGDEGPDLVPVTAAASVGRNDPCPCGSGRKYKKCCGA